MDQYEYADVLPASMSAEPRMITVSDLPELERRIVRCAFERMERKEGIRLSEPVVEIVFDERIQRPIYHAVADVL